MFEDGVFIDDIVWTNESVDATSRIFPGFTLGDGRRMSTVETVKLHNNSDCVILVVTNVVNIENFPSEVLYTSRNFVLLPNQTTTFSPEFYKRDKLPFATKIPTIKVSFTPMVFMFQVPPITVESDTAEYQDSDIQMKTLSLDDEDDVPSHLIEEKTTKPTKPIKSSKKDNCGGVKKIDPSNKRKLHNKHTIEYMNTLDLGALDDLLLSYGYVRDKRMKVVKNIVGKFVEEMSS